MTMLEQQFPCNGKSTHRKDISVKSVHVQHDINASIVKDLHAFIVTRLCIDVVDTNGINAKLFHEVRIALALLGINKRVLHGTVSDM